MIIRKRLKRTPFLTEAERVLLLADLIDATASVSNIAGTYGCYMKHWKRKALNKIELVRRKFVPGKQDSHYKILNEDINDVISDCEFDIIYVDPPYTKRQYSAYYHILETIVLNDNPEINGSTGLRKWQRKNHQIFIKKKGSKCIEIF